MTTKRRSLALGGTAGAGVLATAAAAFLLFGGTSGAVQNPTISLDMVTTGNSYGDVTNTMTVGPVDFCLESATANPSTHTHAAHLVIQNVEDLVGWQARLNYDGGGMEAQYR